MSGFAVEIRCVKEVEKHPNADRLDVVKLENLEYTLVGQRSAYIPGDHVVYFPIDSQMPERLQEHIGIDLGSKNRVKTKKLRGIYSQGLIIPLETALSYLGGADLSDLFGVVKYEPPATLNTSGGLMPLIDVLSKYDIENAEQYPRIIKKILWEQPVLITEKLEGSNWAATINPDSEIVVSQRNYSINSEFANEHLWYKTFYNLGLDTKLKNMQSEVFPHQHVTLRGEIVGPGIQSNYYMLKDNHIYVFDILTDSGYVNADKFIELCERFDIDMVPIVNTGKESACAFDKLFEYMFDDMEMADIAHGPSKLNSDRKREGLVIRPVEEMWDAEIGRVIIKQKDRYYLDRIYS